MRCVRTIVVDVDGTLIPSLVDFEGLRERIRRELGVSHELKPLGLSLSRLPLSDEEKQKAWRIVEEEELRTIALLDPEALRGNIEGLRRLAAEGFRIVIATHRSMETLKPVIEKLGLAGYITEAVTRDYSIDRVEQLRYLKARYGDIVFIGDTVYDEDASARAGVEFHRVASHSDLANVLKLLEDRCREAL
ncbi:HAD family hydrolase [Desulfurococcus mucosus]|uniref:HAD-superfamily hydrolase, subfamily IA, variant 1 n=1 Tax=Desulfurococcus mucosus (strain ATCC 35584 / DSM 2162 / JCM 9187 / O7/1) TaxID=765177 RepID=E8R8S5_DESM0|nr:HAD family hydrolase [Desulfurococcus mucosus]ADV64901.1 HAD-superfamily hydrolase, subfamily IA, variant 1 [Desulfurococcus mucosus DSM 2162]